MKDERTWLTNLGDFIALVRPMRSPSIRGAGTLLLGFEVMPYQHRACSVLLTVPHSFKRPLFISAPFNVLWKDDAPGTSTQIRTDGIRIVMNQGASGR